MNFAAVLKVVKDYGAIALLIVGLFVYAVDLKPSIKEIDRTHTEMISSLKTNVFSHLNLYSTYNNKLIELSLDSLSGVISKEEVLIRKDAIQQWYIEEERRLNSR
jgi:hypothetical protein